MNTKETTNSGEIFRGIRIVPGDSRGYVNDEERISIYDKQDLWNFVVPFYNIFSS